MAVILSGVLTPGTWAQGESRIYVELIEPQLGEEAVISCKVILRYGVYVDHTEPRLCGGTFAITLRNEEGDVVPGVGHDVLFAPVWGSNLTATEIHGLTVSVLILCTGPVFLEPSVKSPLAEVYFVLPENIDQEVLPQLEPRVELDSSELAPYLLFDSKINEDIVLDQSEAVLVNCKKLIRGDSNDDGDTNVSDAVTILEYLFAGKGPVRCLDAADVNDDARVDITDPVYILRYLFIGGPEPPPPFPHVGGDYTADELECAGDHPVVK